MADTPFVRRLTVSLLTLLMLWLFCGLRVERSHAEVMPLAIIVGVRCTVSEISLSELARIYRGAPARNSDGDRFMPLNQPTDSPLRKTFDRVVLAMTPEQASAFWIDQRIRAAGPEPRVISSVALTVRLVSVLSGAIAYVPITAISVSVKVVKVDAKLPGRPDYPLR